MQADTDRTDHATLLPPGATVVFYTDGLIERRAVPAVGGQTVVGNVIPVLAWQR